MIITKELLIERDACDDGIEDFCRFFPGGFDTLNWSLEMQIKIFTKTRLRKYLSWAWKEQLLPMWSMRFANLQGADLQEVDLWWANLEGANLEWVLGL